MKDWDSTKYRAWKSLDEPLSFFGIKGRYMVVFLLLGGFAGLFALALGNTFGRFVTISFMAVALVADYLVIQMLQNRFTEREFSRMLAKNKMRLHVKVLPVSLDSMMEELSYGDEDNV